MMIKGQIQTQESQDRRRITLRGEGGREGGEERRLTHSIVLYRLLGYCRYSLTSRSIDARSARLWLDEFSCSSS